ncbi:MAG: iron-containing alcohol dehydrogenase [Geminicoccaceae bacterium]
MSSDPIVELLSNEFRLHETGERFTSPIESLVIADSLDGWEGDLLLGINFPTSPAIVCDPTTYDVLARRIAGAIPGATLTVLDKPRADEATATALFDQTRHADALIAVGSGTLNDLAKYTSHQRRQPYAVFATAPSMNGFVTATASITQGGEKLSLPATPPRGAFFDLAILADAPDRLIRAGVGDSLCRSTAEIDWMVSHQLFGTDFLETPFAIQARDEANLLACIADLELRNPETISALVRLLVLGGLGMLITGNSQPGSQGEHLISHYIDMLHRPHSGSLHGEQVGLATRTMATLQHHLLTSDDPPVLAATSTDLESLSQRFGRWHASARAVMARKTLSKNRLNALNERLEACWPGLRAAFAAKALPIHQLQATFDIAGIADDPRDLGIAPSFYREAVLHARELRDRYTVLDLATDGGLLDPFADRHLAKIFGET